MAQALAVAGTDFQCEVNHRDHRTVDFGFSRLIVRRGAPFTITVSLSGRGFQPGQDQISVVVETGLAPSERSGTKVQFPMSNSLVESKWNAAFVRSVGTQLSLSICSPANAKIGHYTLKLLCATQGQSALHDLGKFTLLFNPWCSDDAVFLDVENQRKEYVLNDQGLIYMGSNKYISNIAWNFGQFEYGIVDICLKLLDNSSNCLANQDEDCSQRHDPVYISRIVTAMVNCNDDKGILRGNWSGDYSHGTSPTTWNGSITILRGWNNSNCQPVSYGQCWVFAAVACTVLRCLGIPTRLITNFNSAHDTEQNLRIDSFVDENGKKVRKSRDSIWNFHCWVESWMTRPDLKPGYDGWQVLDPTPQEKSEGIYCCGPAPVKAIKHGDIDQKFDCPFVFAEVNADYVSWLIRKDGTKKEIMVNHRVVGQKISTKAIGTDEREDVTKNYKHVEGSKEEREAFTRADMKNKPAQEPDKNLKIKLKMEKNNMNGTNFDVSAVIMNKTSEAKNCRLILCAQTIMYNGQSIQECGWKDLASVTVGPHGEQTETLQLLYSNYGQSLSEHNQILIVALAMNYEAEELAVCRKVTTLQNPTLHIKILGEPLQYRDLIAEISFTNPLPESLCNGRFLVEGAGLTDEQMIPCPMQSIAPGQEVKVRIICYPQKSGLRKLTVDFDCNKLKDVKGFKNVIIRPMDK